MAYSCRCGKEFGTKRGLKVHKARHCPYKDAAVEKNPFAEAVQPGHVIDFAENGALVKAGEVQQRLF